MNTPIDLQSPKLGKELLRKLSSKEITMEEFDKETAYWVLEHIEALRWKPAPSQPGEVADYNRRRSTNKDFTLPKEFWQQQHIRAWLATDTHIVCENRSSWYWLQFLKNHIPPQDGTAHIKISKMMSSYPRHDNSYVLGRKDFI